MNNEELIREKALKEGREVPFRPMPALQPHSLLQGIQ